MDKKLRRIENKILLYFQMVANGCNDYIDTCEYTPYYCGYSKASKRAVNTYELCLFEADIIKCPGEIEKHYREKHDKSVYRSTLRAIDGMEKKGYLKREKLNGRPDNSTNRWFMTYRLAEHGDSLEE